jgi:hypothetical protein
VTVTATSLPADVSATRRDSSFRIALYHTRTRDPFSRHSSLLNLPCTPSLPGAVGAVWPRKGRLGTFLKSKGSTFSREFTDKLCDTAAAGFQKLATDLEYASNNQLAKECERASTQAAALIRTDATTQAPHCEEGIFDHWDRSDPRRVLRQITKADGGRSWERRAAGDILGRGNRTADRASSSSSVPKHLNAHGER